MAAFNRPVTHMLLTAMAMGLAMEACGKVPTTRKSGQTGALMGDRQLGLAMPVADSLDFTVIAAEPLAQINIDPRADSLAKVNYVEGASAMTVKVHLETGELTLHPAGAQGESDRDGWVAVAWAQYNNTVKKNGWAYFSVASTPDRRVSRDLTMYAAGFLEGFVSAKSIRDFQHNAGILLQNDEQKHQALGNIRDVFGRSVVTICNKSGMDAGSGLLDGTAPEDAWWKQARYALLQAWGILDAYNRQVGYVEGKAMSMVDLLILNSDGETPELEVAYDMEEELLRQSNKEDGNASDAQLEADADIGNASAPAAAQVPAAASGAGAGSSSPGTGESWARSGRQHWAGVEADADPSNARAPAAPQAFLQRRAKHHTATAAAARPARVPFASTRAARRAHRAADLRSLDAAAWRRIKETSGRCSALVRLTAGNKDLLVGHTTFSDYSEMNRIFKYYDLLLGDDVVRRMGFSSYPGVAGSTDDYYLLDSGLVITETTISMLSDEPYDRLESNAEKVPDFMRIMLANRLARSGDDWVGLMRKSSTGTYSSQWMVVDYGRFAPGSPPRNGTLLVLEQVPGMSRSEDMSTRLGEKGYWSSENRPWFKEVRDFVGASEAEELHGKLFSADDNPRARIFKATAPEVQTLADMRAEMRRNRWPHEAALLSEDAPEHAIAARGDLDAEHPNPNGGVDAKVTNLCLARQLRCDAISGPSAASQRPFRWSNATTGKDLYPDAPHDGLPDLWNFDWVRMSPDGEEALTGECAV